MLMKEFFIHCELTGNFYNVTKTPTNEKRQYLSLSKLYVI